jgi:hypothetical protein
MYFITFNPNTLASEEGGKLSDAKRSETGSWFASNMSEEKKLPTMQIEKAVQLARKYLSDNEIDVSTASLTNANWNSKTKGGESFWLLRWRTLKQFEKFPFPGGGHLSVRVFEDGKIKAARAR